MSSSSSDKKKKVYGPTLPPPPDSEDKIELKTTDNAEKKLERSDTSEQSIQRIRSRSRSPPSSRHTDKQRTVTDHNPNSDDSEDKEQLISTQIDEYNSTFRSKPLQEIYEKEFMRDKKRVSEQDRDEKIFDWERDMNSTVRRMSEKSAKTLLNDSSLKDRFGSSSKKKYL